jgi:hypothetical protein
MPPPSFDTYAAPASHPFQAVCIGGVVEPERSQRSRAVASLGSQQNSRGRSYLRRAAPEHNPDGNGDLGW